MTMKFYKYVSKLEKIKYPIYCGLQERRQFVCFLLTTFVELIYIPANLVELNDYHNSMTLKIYNWVHLVFACILQVLFWKNKVSTRTALYAFFIAIAIKLSTESLYELFVVGINSSHILGNFNIILILAAVAVSIRIKNLAYLITAILTLDLFIFCYIGENNYVTSVMRIFFVGYMLIVFVSLFDTKDSARGLRLPNNVTKEQQRAIDMLINLNDCNIGKKISFLSRLSEEQQEELMRKMKDYYQEQQAETANFQAAFPSLTNSEVEICKLVAKGKTLKEVCAILGKEKSNITCQRTHIRRKLGLDKNEDLRDALIRGLGEKDK